MGTHKTFMYIHDNCMDYNLTCGVQSELANLMSPCVSNLYEGNWVYFADASTKAGSHECLVYFLRRGVSVVKNAPRTQWTASALDMAGNTSPYSGASEVYVDNTDAKLLARVAFHELLHNRLQMGNEMHKDDGLRSGKEINSSTPLTNGNKKDMAAGIGAKVPQWNAGLSMFSSGLHDPMSEYYKP